MPMIFEETAEFPGLGMLRTTPALAAIFRNSRRFTSNLKAQLPYSDEAMNIEVSGFHFQEPFWIRFSQQHSVSHNCYCLHEWLIGLCNCRAASFKLSAS